LSRNSVTIVRDPSDAIAGQAAVRWAVEHLRDALATRQVSTALREQMDESTADGPCILVAHQETAWAREALVAANVSIPAAPEALGLVSATADQRKALLACGSDVRGLVYALLELADRVVHGDNPLAALKIGKPIVEQPANPIRSIARLFTSEVEDKPWFCDKSFWQRYLTMLVTQRFNRFSLTLGLGYDHPRQIRDAYFYFPYPFLVSVPGYDVRAVGLPEAERDRNLAMLRFISDEAALRGLHFQLALWSHAYEFADSPDANYTIAGLTPETHAPYCRDALRTLLQACPNIAGVTFRVHGESGIPERSYAFWKTVFDGMVQCGRRVEIDMHAKGIDQETIDVALATGLPVNVSAKYSAEHQGLPYHQASIRQLELSPPGKKAEGPMAVSGIARRFTRYSYADLLIEDRRYDVFFRIWPGTQRLLLWGDPALAAGYGRFGSFCGCLGVEVCEPLTFKGRKGSGAPGPRDGYADASLRPLGGDWEKYLYTYRLFGRLLYNPDTEPETWRRFLGKQFGAAAESVEAALANASRILPLMTTAHHPSASNNGYWPEVYTNMPIVDEKRPHPYGDTASPKRFGTVSSLDPVMFSSIEEFAAEVVSGNRSGRISPLDVARWLQTFSEAAARMLVEAHRSNADTRSSASRRVAFDVVAQFHLGWFFAQKLRAGVCYALYQRTDDLGALRAAITWYRMARGAWADLVERTKGIYRSDLAFGAAAHLRGHWADRLQAIDDDLRDMEEKAKGTEGEAGPIFDVGLLHSPPLRLRCEHTPPVSFRRGEPLGIELTLTGGSDALTVRLHYRHVNQAEAYVVAEMERTENRYRVTIPGTYTDSPYPLQYFFELRGKDGQAWLWPGLNAELSSQPYFVVRQERR